MSTARACAWATSHGRSAPRVRIEPLRAAPQVDEDGLRHVLGERAVAAHPPGDRPDGARVAAVQLGEGVAVAVDHRRHHRHIVGTLGVTHVARSGA